MDGTIKLWDVTNLEARPRVLQAKNTVSSVDFSPDGKLLAGQAGGTLLLWNLEHLEDEPLLIESSGVGDARFSPVGQILGGTTSTGVSIWHYRTADIAEMVRKTVWRNLTLDEWNTYVGRDCPYECTIPDLPPGLGAPGGPPVER